MNENTNSEKLLSMEEAIKILKTTRPTFYRWLRAGKIKGMKIGRQWRFYPEDIERFLKGEQPQIELPSDISPLIQELQSRLEVDLPNNVSEDSAVYAVDLMIRLAIQNGVSDIHLEPMYFSQEKFHQAILRFRQDGQLKTVYKFDRRLLPHIIEQWKILSQVDLNSELRGQEGQFSFNVTPLESDSFEFRTAFLTTSLGESMTARLLNKTVAEKITLEKLDFSPHVHTAYLKALNQSWGLIVANGPSGCGKTTTLYAGLNQLAKPELKTFAIENSAELMLPWVLSVPVKAHEPLGFSRALRATMLHDPDIIMVSEIPDAECLKMAIQTALTGHLVLTTLHSEDSLKALYRLIEVSGNAYSVSESVKFILSQRLVRRLCQKCCVQRTQQDLQSVELEYLCQLSGYALEKLTFYQAVGCEYCSQMGYRGRLLISEALEITSEIRESLFNEESEAELREKLKSRQYKTLLYDGLEKVNSGYTSIEEVVRVLGLT